VNTLYLNQVHISLKFIIGLKMQKNENNTLNEENFVDEDILIDEAKSKNSTRRTITGNHEMEYYRLIIIEFNFI
jgi:hypothetical protein